MACYVTYHVISGLGPVSTGVAGPRISFYLAHWWMKASSTVQVGIAVKPDMSSHSAGSDPMTRCAPCAGNATWQLC
jgi:hypothetical protein